jgi:hypothetical protein
LDDEGPGTNGCGLGQWKAAPCLVLANYVGAQCPHNNMSQFSPCGPFGQAWAQFLALVRSNTSGSSGGSSSAGGSIF